VRRAGGAVLAQALESCVVSAMPEAAQAAQPRYLSPPQLAAYLAAAPTVRRS